MQKDQRENEDDESNWGPANDGGMNGQMIEGPNSEIKAVLFTAICISELTKMNIHRHNPDDPPGHAK